MLPKTLSAMWANWDHDANYLDAYNPLMRQNYWLPHIQLGNILLLEAFSQMMAPPFLILELNKYYSSIPTSRQRLSLQQ